MTDTIIYWKYNEIHELCNTKSKLSRTTGESPYGDRKIKYIKSLTWCATNLTLRGEHIDPSDFDANLMEYCIDEAKLEYEGEKKDPDIKKPDKFSYSKWVAWEEMVYTYFTAMKNIR